MEFMRTRKVTGHWLTKGHYQKFIMPLMNPKGIFMNIFWFHINLMITSSKVNF